MDTQVTSYELQVQNYTEYITHNEDWVFAGIYADEGISGTSMLHRDEFNRMLEDARQHKFDLIITKQINRFSRNILDSISTIRMLKALDPPVHPSKDERRCGANDHSERKTPADPGRTERSEKRVGS